MATEDKKPETKKTEEKQSPQVKEDLPPPPPQPLPLPLPYKTCSFKVSIHCEGCKRKVKKILSSIEGVYRVEIDVKLHKVTVMGIASPEILLQKLLKAGKNALLLPEIPDPVENKPVVPKEKKMNKKKKKEEEEEKPEKSDGATSSSSGNDKPESEKTDAVKESNSGDGGDTSGPVKEEKKENVLKEKTPVQADSPAEKKAEENGGDAVATGSGNVGKKKKKKGQNQKLSSANNPTGAPARPGSPSPPPTTTTPAAAADHDRPFNQNEMLTNNNTPGQHMYHPYPASYYAPQVMYGVSYNVAQSPVSVDSASYYTPPPPHSYAYMHPGYLPPHDQNPYPSRPSDSFELFSDENPNGCTIM